MKKMIGVINDNLRSVVNGIKEHRSDTEKSLTAIKNDIDVRVETASKYKTDVESARSIILGLEAEISELENDLKELNEKFGSKNFREILAAGDKEINTKITEKRKLIAEQNDIIINITKKAHSLKRELSKLKEKKDIIDSDLNKTLILEGYYEKRINAIVDFSVEHPEELATYKEIDEVDDLNTEEIEDIDIGNIIDGQVFNEIDSISEGKVPNEEELQKALEMDDNTDAVDDENDETDETDEGNDLSKIDDLINTASEIIDRNELNETLESDTVTAEIEETVLDSISDDSLSLDLKSDDSMVDSTSDLNMIEIKETEEVTTDLEDTKNEENVVDLPIENDSEENTLNISVDVEDDKPIDSSLIESGIKEHKKLHSMSEPITVNLDVFEQNDESNFSDIAFSDDNGYSLEALTECGLNASDFAPEDLKLLETKFDKDNTLKFIEVLKKHGLDVDKIYTSVGVLLNVTPQNLDKLLSMLEGVSEEKDISYIFRYLDKVNISRLEQNIALAGENESLTDLLVTAMSTEGNADLTNLLNITDKDVAMIKKNFSDDYNKMINFPEIVFANYNTLKGYNIDNSVECITNHPHRFTIDPSKFSAILDKYDPSDLVRCVNKNSAVIDKL